MHQRYRQENARKEPTTKRRRHGRRSPELEDDTTRPRVTAVMLTHIPFPVLPAPPSWFPGHMLQFQRNLPHLLTRTDVVLELRDARLPLTSINRKFEGA